MKVVKDDEFVLSEGGDHFTDNFNPVLAAVGGNLTVFNLVFAEGHRGTCRSRPGL